MFLGGHKRVMFASWVFSGGRKSGEDMALTSVRLGHMAMTDGSSAAPVLTKEHRGRPPDAFLAFLRVLY